MPLLSARFFPVQSSHAAARTHRDVVPVLLLLLGAALAHGRILFHPFVNVGDPELLLENPFLGRAPDADALRWVLAAGAQEGPLARILVLLLGSFSGPAPYVFHAASLFLHALTAVVLFATLRRYSVERGASFLTASTFALHPQAVESVAWAASIGVVLGGALFLLGTWMLAGAGESAGRRRLGFALALQAVLAEPAFVGGPLALGALERWRRRRAAPASPSLAPTHPGKASARTGAERGGFARSREILVWLALGVVVFAFTRVRQLDLPPDLPFVARLVRMPHAVLALAAQAPLPLGLAHFHPHPALAGLDVFPPGPVFLGWLLLVALIALVLLGARRFPVLELAGSWFLALVVPASLWPSSDALFAERWGYGALIGFELALALALTRVLSSRPLGLALAGSLVLVALGWLAWRRTGDWRTSVALHESALASTRANWRAHDGLGLALRDHGRLSAAVREHELSLGIRPRAPDSFVYLGELEIRRALIPGAESHLVQAREFLERALALAPDHARAQATLGEIFQRLGEPASARTHLEAATALAPERPTPHTRLGMVALELQDLEAAEHSFERSVALRSDLPDAWCGLGIVCQARGEPESAVQFFQRSLEAEPDYVEARTGLGKLFLEAGDRPGAERELRRAISVNPDYTEALYVLASLLAEAGRTDEAAPLLERAVVTRPGHVRSSVLLARILLERGELQESLELLKRVEQGNPRHLEANLLLGRIALQGGKLELARTHFERALEADPQSVDALEGLAAVCARSNDLQRATELLKRAIALSPAARRAALAAKLERLQREGSGD